MGQQTNKTQKRTRRKGYLKRLKERIKTKKRAVAKQKK
jgi:hypothetical protein